MFWFLYASMQRGRVSHMAHAHVAWLQRCQHSSTGLGQGCEGCGSPHSLVAHARPVTSAQRPPLRRLHPLWPFLGLPHFSSSMLQKSDLLMLLIPQLPALSVLLRQQKLILLPQVIAREPAVLLGLYQGQRSHERALKASMHRHKYTQISPAYSPQANNSAPGTQVDCMLASSCGPGRLCPLCLGSH